jgi:hypothetical protein
MSGGAADAKETLIMKVLLALSAFTAASADVAFRWPDSGATTLAAILFGPLVFAIVWLTVRRGGSGVQAETGETPLPPTGSRFDSAEEAVDF